MKDLRYIKLFEAFESSKLNKTLNFLNKDGKEKFLSKLKQICKKIDLPESKLSDDLFQYLPYASAVKYNGDAVSKMPCTNECDKGKVTRKWGRGTRVMDCATCKGTGKVDRKTQLSLVKFWFNKDGEYLSVTGVDGLYRPGNIPVDGQVRAFSNNMDDYNLGDRVPKTRMGDSLITGDIVKLTLIDRSWRSPGDKANVIAYIIKDRGRLWAIQDLHSYSRNYLNIPYSNIGARAWEMTNGSIRDIYKLNLKAGNARIKDPMGYNTDLDLDLKVKSVGIRDSVKNANFAIILDLNKLGSLEFTKKADIIDKRKESKKDALALMTDEEVKSVNLKKYFEELKKRTKIVGSIEDIAMFSKIVVRVLGGKYAAYNLSNSSTDYLSNHVLSNIASKIFQIMKAIKKNQREGSLDDYLLGSDFKQLVDSTNELYDAGLNEMMAKNKAYSEYLVNAKKKIKTQSTDADEASKHLKVIELIDTLSSQITKLISSMPCECLEDVEIMLQEVTNIRRMMSGDRSGLNTLAHFFVSMNPGHWNRGDVYSGLRRATLPNVINGLNHLISVIKRKQEIYKK